MQGTHLLYWLAIMLFRSFTRQGGLKVGLQLQLCETQFILVLVFIIYYIILHINCKPTFAPPCIWRHNSLLVLSDS